MFYNIINVFAVTFDQFNLSLLNTDPKLLNISVLHTMKSYIKWMAFNFCELFTLQILCPWVQVLMDGILLNSLYVSMPSASIDYSVVFPCLLTYVLTLCRLHCTDIAAY